MSLPQVEACQLNLPKLLHSSPSPHITSLLCDPISHSLALQHSDSSFSLYPSFYPFSSLSSFPSPQTLVPSPTSAAAFLRLQTSVSSATLFVSFAPLPRHSGATLIRFHLLDEKGSRFTRVKVVCNHRDLEFDGDKWGVVFKVAHGVSVKLSGGVNLFSVYSVSNSKIWVFAVKLVADEEIKLMKCAVIDCCFPVFTMRISHGFLILGEDNGVRVFPLRPLVKGRAKKEKRANKRSNMQNIPVNCNDEKPAGRNEDVTLSVKGEKSDRHSDSAKLRTVKLRQDSRDLGAHFVAFKSEEEESIISMKTPAKSTKAISIHPLSANKFVILDSVGDLHLLCLTSSVNGLENLCHFIQLPGTMKVRKLAIPHDLSTRGQTIYMSDGQYSVHQMVVPDSVNETEIEHNDEKLKQISVVQAIFVSEKIQEIVPLDASGILVLGQGKVFAYATS